MGSFTLVKIKRTLNLKLDIVYYSYATLLLSNEIGMGESRDWKKEIEGESTQSLAKELVIR